VIPMPRAVLRGAFSFDNSMAFASAQRGNEWPSGSVPPNTWARLLSNLFWVLAYGAGSAMVDRDHDLRIGMTTSAITLGRFDVPAGMLFYGLHLACWTVLGGDCSGSAGASCWA